jgi:hypothetical protein
MLAPETSLQKIQSQNKKKQQSYKGALEVKGLLEWEKKFLKERVDEFGDINEERNVCIIDRIKYGSRRIAGQWINCQRKRADQKRNGINNPDELK